MAFGRKRELMLALRPDLLVLQECAERDITGTAAAFRFWVGENPHKGLGVLGFARHDYRIDPAITSDLPWFIPLTIADLDVRVLAAWSHVKTSTVRYVRLTHLAMDHYEQFLDARSIVIGDLNSNSIWDAKHPGRNHSQLVERLAARGLHSVYHRNRGELHGEESAPTHYLYRHLDRPYHLDYAFAGEMLLRRAKLEVGGPDEWLRYSDHVPLVLDLKVAVATTGG